MSVIDTAKLELQRQAEEALERVKTMCRKAFDDGARAGYQKGFADGVAAMGPPPSLAKQEARRANDA